MNLYTRLILCLFLTVLVNCSDDDKSPAGGPGGGGGAGDTGGYSAQQIESFVNEVADHNFFLKYDVDFRGAPGKVEVRLEGTELEHKVKAIRVLYSNKIPLTPQQESDGTPYCGFTIEVDPQSSDDNVIVRGGRSLRKVGSWTRNNMKNNNGVVWQEFYFGVYLQYSNFQAMILECRNVTSSNEVLQHLGDLLILSERTDD